MIADGFGQVIQDIAAMQAARLHDSQDPLHEAAARLTRAAKAGPMPQHRAPQQALHDIVGRLHSLHVEERPQGRFQHQHVRTELRHRASAHIPPSSWALPARPTLAACWRSCRSGSASTVCRSNPTRPGWCRSCGRRAPRAIHRRRFRGRSTSWGSRTCGAGRDRGPGW